MARAKVTTDHTEIQRWAEGRGGRPAQAPGTGNDEEAGVLVIDFVGYGDELDEISWEDFFEKFEDNNLALLYQETLDDGSESRFFKLVDRDGEEAAPRPRSKQNRARVGTAGRKGKEKSKSMARYGPKAGQKVEKAMHEYKRGELKSSSGQKVKSRKQAIAIGLSEAREAGGKVPSRATNGRKRTAKASAGRKRTTSSRSRSGGARKRTTTATRSRSRTSTRRSTSTTSRSRSPAKPRSRRATSRSGSSSGRATSRRGSSSARKR